MKRRPTRILIAATGGALVFFGASSPASGANIKATPTLALQGVYDSNLFSTAENEVSDYYFKAVPALKLSLELPGTTLDLNGSFEIDRYAKHDELDSENATVNLGLSASKPIQASPRLSVVPTVRYLDTKDTYRRTQLTQAPVAGLPPSDTLVVGRIRTRDTAASLSLGYLLSPDLDFAVGGAYAKREFLEQDPAFIDSDVSSATASLSHRLSPRFHLGPSLSASRTRYEDGDRTETYGGAAAFTYLAGPQFTLAGRVGADYFRDMGPGKVVIDEKWLPSAAVTGTYVRGDFTGTLGLFYGVAGGGGGGVTTKRGSAIATAASRFTARWDWSLSAVYQTNVSASGLEGADYSTFEFDAGTGYLAAPWARVRISGTFFRQWASPPFGDDVSRETVFAGIDLFTTYTLF